MKKRSKQLFVALAITLFAATPIGGRAEGGLRMADAPPEPPAGLSVICTAETLPVRAAELKPMHITCVVVGGLDTDTSFSVSSTDPENAGDASVPVCAGSLTDGAGTCTELARDGEGMLLGRLKLTARLEPSGTTFSVPPPVSATTLLAPER